MKKTFEKNETRRPSTGEAAFHCSDEKPAVDCSELQCKHKASEDSCFSARVSGNLKSFSLCFDNPDFSERDSNVFSLNSQQSTALHSPKSTTDSLHRKKESGSTDTIHLEKKFSFNEISAAKSKPALSLKLENRSKSLDSLARLSNNLLLRKTDEISDFYFKTFKEMSITKDNTLACTVERLVLTDEERPGRSDLSAAGTQMNLFSELDLIESQTGDCNRLDKKFLKYVPFRNKRTVKKKPVESQDKKNEGFWSKKSYFKKARVLNFVLDKKESTSKRSIFTQLNTTVAEEPKPKLLRERFAYSEVPVWEDLKTKQYFKDILFYIIYLIILTTIAMNMMSKNMFYFSNMTSSLFLDSTIEPVNTETFKTKVKFSGWNSLRNMHTVDDFWRFAESTMIELLFWKFYYVDVGKKEKEGMLFENQIIGVPRMRQLRVTKNSCTVHPNVKKFFKDCYSSYSPFSEETHPIKEGMENSSTASAWVYTNAKRLNTTHYWGDVSLYGGGGYYLDLKKNENETKEMINELKENNWISKATRVVFIDFTIYNANTNLFCLCKIVVEFPPVGGVMAHTDFRSLKLIRYLSTSDFFILGWEFLLVLFALYFTTNVIKDMIKKKSVFFLSYWGYIDLTIVSLLYIFIIIGIIRYLTASRLLLVLSDRINQYTEFNNVKALQINFNNVTAVLVFVSWLKLIMYFTFNVIVLELSKALEMSFKGVLGFLPMFLIVYLAFVFLAHLLFGSEAKEYNTLWSSFVTLFQVMLGDVYFGQIQETNRILGPVFCIAYIFFIFFIFLNVFIAIVNNAYASVKSNVLLIRPKVWEYTKRGTVNLATCCRPRKNLRRTLSVKKKFVFCEIRDALENAGFTKDEIQIFFSKYNIDLNNILEEGVRRKVVEDLELKRIELTETSRENELNFLRRRVDNLNSRIENIEIHLQPVIDKVDILLDRLSKRKCS